MRLPILRLLTAERRGSVAIMIAVMAAVLIAVASLAVEIGLALRTQRQMQLAADDAATAAMSAQLTNFPQNWQQEGYGAADGNGFGGSNWGKPPDCLSKDAATRPWIYVGIPCDGPHTGNSSYVEAFLEMDFPLRLAKVVFGNNFVLHGRAVATSTTITGCVAVLDPSDPKTFWVHGNSVNVTLNGCDIFVDSNASGSTSSTAAAVNDGNGTVSCDKLYVGGTANPNPIVPSGCPTIQNAQPVGDPYQNVQVPSSPVCSGSPTAITVKSGTTVIQPACYSQLVVQTSGATLELCPGLYKVYSKTANNPNNPPVSVTAGGALKSLSSSDADYSQCTAGGSGVTIVLTGDKPADIPSVNFSSGATISLTAQTCNSTNCTVNGVAFPFGIPSDMLFYQDRTATSAVCSNTAGAKNLNSFTAGLGQTFTGILYFPQGCIQYSGSVQSASCFEMIAWTVEIQGGAQFNAALCSPFAEKIQPVLLAE